MSRSTPSLGQHTFSSPRSARIASAPFYTWTTLPPALRQKAVGLAASHDRHMRRVRRRAILLTILAVVLVMLLTILLFSNATGAHWIMLPAF